MGGCDVKRTGDPLGELDTSTALTLSYPLVPTKSLHPPTSLAPGLVRGCCSALELILLGS